MSARLKNACRLPAHLLTNGNSPLSKLPILKLSLVNLAVNQGFRINAVIHGDADTLLTQGTGGNPSKHSKLAEIVGVILCYLGLCRDPRNLKSPAHCVSRLKSGLVKHKIYD